METDELVKEIGINNPEIKELIERAYKQVQAMDKGDGVTETYYKFGYTSLEDCQVHGIRDVKAAILAGLSIIQKGNINAGLDCIAESLIMLENLWRKLKLTLERRCDFTKTEYLTKDGEFKGLE